MNPAVLLLSSLYDFSTDELALGLASAEVPYLRLNREQLAEHRLSLDPLSRCLKVDGPAGTCEVGPKLRSIWYRHPVFLRNPVAASLTPAEQLSRSQWQAFVHALTVFSDASWMNHPAATYQAESKPYQLSQAAHAGFLVPPSLIGNDATAIHKMFPGPVAVKSVDSAVMREDGDSLFAYTWLGSSEDLDSVSLSNSPVIAQRAFADKVDWRVTVVGESISAVRVLTKGVGAVGDWRRSPRESLTYVETDLPPPVSAACYRLLQSLGLTFGAIDLIQDCDRFYFIEVNPTGEWGWLSTPDRPIGTWIVDWLANPPRNGRDQ